MSRPPGVVLYPPVEPYASGHLEAGDRAWPESRFELVPDAGHPWSEPGIERLLVEATDRFARS